ncbi:MAG TPA: S1C family serine protease [Candidatus Sulfotelmatobacter sp.]|nr:S1C family serine protease [Candidatus Sulfotelmatobacter sp.]
MADIEDWEFPLGLQPKPEAVDFDLDAALAAVVAVRTEVPEDAFTATLLGTERLGNGVVIGSDGLVLTIGYLITEAETIWLTSVTGHAAPAHLVAYDQATGFGLVQALGRLGVPALRRGASTGTDVGEIVVVAGFGGRRHALSAELVAKREFAGYWEYVLDEALFTAPAHPQWGGAAVINSEGELIGIGSLLIQDARHGEGSSEGNMSVPIDLLDPIFDDMLHYGRSRQPVRPWLGMYTAESKDGLVVAGVARGGPAHRAEVQPGDRVIEVAGMRPAGLGDLFRKVWAVGAAGAEIPLTLQREGATLRVRLRSADRGDFLKKPRLQ